MTQKKAAPAPQVETIDRTLVDQMIADAMAKDSARKERESMRAVEVGKHGLHARDMLGLFELAKMVVRSGWAPKGFTAEACFVAMAKGAEVGLTHMESLSSIAVVNGRPAIWGDAMLALVMRSGLLDNHKVTWSGTAYEDDYACTVTVWRKGLPSPVTETFSVARAKHAGLWGKAGPWVQYPDRMLELRARGFALRNAFPDVLRGLMSAEEAGDIEPGDHDDDPDGAVTLPAIDPSANPLDQVMALHGGGDKSSNGEATETEPDPPQDAAPEPESEEPEDEPKCSQAQGKRLALLGAKLFPKVATKEMPAHLSGLGWAWNEGPLAEPVSRLGELSERVAGEMIAELEVLVSEAEEAKS